MSGTRVTRSMVDDAASRALGDGWRVACDDVTARWRVEQWRDGKWRVMLAGLTAREMWGALEVLAATKTDEPTTDDEEQ